MAISVFSAAKHLCELTGWLIPFMPVTRYVDG